MVDADELEPLINYYQKHYDRYSLGSHNVPLITDEEADRSKVPDDEEEVENECSAPPVKSGYIPKKGADQ